MKPTLCLAALLIVFAPAIARAEVPLAINYQGYLTSDAGAPVTGTRSMTFAIYSVAEAGSALWTETRSVPVTGGIFNLYLGDVTALPDSIFTGQALYLGVRIEGDTEMTPRIRLATVPYAFASERNALPGTRWFRDADDDGFGNRYVWQKSLNRPAGYVADSTDCNDAEPAIHPGAPETCDGVDSDCNLQDGYPETCNGLDDDCSGTADDNMIGPECPLQYGVCSGSRMVCGGALGWLPCGAEAYGPHYEPTEATCDNLDNDCDMQVDEGVTCDDGLPCTYDMCYGGGCQHSPMPNTCLIAGACYGDGDVNPANECQVCNPALSVETWSPKPDGTGCAGGTCQGGSCQP